MTVEDIQEAIRVAVAEAYERGFTDGKRAITASLMEFTQNLTPSVAVAEPRTTQEGGVDLQAGNLFVQTKMTQRAPKGLTEKVLRQVLDHGFALPMEEVQRRAVETDGRISAKTVYNELYRRPHYIRDDNGRWRLRRDGEMLQLKVIDPTEERERQEARTAH